MARGYLLDHLGEVTALFKKGPIGLLLDLDGTISEIVPGPEDARVSLPTKAALRELCQRLPLVAIITGRAAQQAMNIVGLQEPIYVGNHGLERLERGRAILAEEVRPFIPFFEQLVESLRARFPSVSLLFEDKGGSFAVHYRLADNPVKAREDALEAIRELAGERVRVLMGKSVINVLPQVNLTKGTAVISLVNEYGLSGVILIGDDVTDIDAFRAASSLSSRQGPGQGFGSISIAVIGPDSPPGLESEADFTLSRVSEVEGFLIWLVEQVDLT